MLEESGPNYIIMEMWNYFLPKIQETGLSMNWLLINIVIKKKEIYFIIYTLYKYRAKGFV